MTPEQEKVLDNIYRSCEKLCKNSRSESFYNLFKNRIVRLNLSPYEYEAAIRRITETIGV